MTDYTITNFTSLKDLFLERVIYEAVFSLPMDSDRVGPANIKGVKNYWHNENLFYGKVNKKFQAIKVMNISLSAYESDGEIFHLLPEVIQPFVQMKNLFTSRYKNGLLSEDPYLSEIKIHKAFHSAEMDYDSYITKIVEKFNNDLIGSQKDSTVKTIKDYFDLFFEEIIESNEISNFSRTSYYMSPEVSSLSSGLSFDISPLNPSKNEDKQLFLDSFNFDFYRESAINFGFNINKNIPWRLSLNLSSPVIRPLLGSEVSDPVENYLNTRFSKTSTGELQYIASAILVGYNSFVDRKPSYRDGVCLFKRKKYDFDELVGGKLPIGYFIKNYLKIKNKENANLYNSSELEKIYFNAMDLKGRPASKYIQSKFNLPYYFRGSTVYKKAQRLLGKNSDFSLDKFDKHVKLIIKNSIDKIY